jgi:KaiC/GvpD/RAD55 family RecA-like ATPase
MLARNIIRRLFNFMKKWYQTAIFVSQKRSGHDTKTRFLEITEEGLVVIKDPISKSRY